MSGAEPLEPTFLHGEEPVRAREILKTVSATLVATTSIDEQRRRRSPACRPAHVKTEEFMLGEDTRTT